MFEKIGKSAGSSIVTTSWFYRGTDTFKFDFTENMLLDGFPETRWTLTCVGHLPNEHGGCYVPYLVHNGSGGVIADAVEEVNTFFLSVND